MAEIIDLNINIGANTTDFEGALQKAQNLLSQFQGALKKATNVGEINYLNTQIKGLEGTISGIKNQMNSVARPTADATNALSNLSRVAQDAPYGFIGIANNLNPLLESFQRLSKETGSSSAALKQMVAGLAGPAGIGIALGVVSSLAVTFSKEISEFFKGPTEKLKTFREELNKLNQDIYKIVGEAQSNRTVGLNLVNIISGGDTKSQQEALKRLKSLYSENKAIKDATIETDKAYLIHLVNVAAIQQDAAGKEKNTQQILSAAYAERAKLLAEQKNQIGALKPIVTSSGGIGDFGGKVISVESQKAAIEKRNKPLIDSLNSVIVTAKSKNLELVTTLTDIETPDPNNSPVVNYAREENKALTLELSKMKALRDKMKSIGLDSLKTFELPSDTRAEEKKRKGYFQGKEKDLLEESNKTGFGAFVQNKIKQDKADIDSDEARKKRLQDLNKKYSEIAQNVSQNVTGALFGMYDAMQQGISAGEALGQMFSRLARSIAESLVQAAIFAGVLSLISGGAAGGGVSFFGAFKSVLGLASGGVATGPTLAMIGEGSESEAVLPLSKLGNMMQTSFNAGSMNTNSMAQNGQFVLKGNDLVLALQRSNYSLNLRRGV
jgi:hypothetical protein